MDEPSVRTLFFNNVPPEAYEESSDYSDIISGIAATATINGMCCFVVDFEAHSIIYASEHFLMAERSMISEQNPDCINPYWTLASDETLEKLLNLREKYIQVGKLLTPEEYGSHVCVIDFPLLNRKKICFVNQRFTPLVMRKDGITKLGLFVMTMSQKKTMEAIIVTQSRKRLRFDFSQKRFVQDCPGIYFDVVDKAILAYIKQGMQNENIANELCLSINTIKSRKQKIYKKLGVSNAAEALIAVSNYLLL